MAAITAQVRRDRISGEPTLPVRDASVVHQMKVYRPRYQEGCRTSAIVERYGFPEPVDVDFVIPVYNEQDQLESSVKKLGAYLSGTADEHGAIIADGVPSNFSWRIVIADNASTDGTWVIASELSERYPDHVRSIRINRKGRGFALKTAWGESKARAVAYMDVDLSTGLEHIDSLILPILAGTADIAIGSRLMGQSDIRRSFKREAISRSYNFLLHTYSGARFHDAQCGFKAMSAASAEELLPRIADDEWFFDTELLLLAQSEGKRLEEVPVRWIEDSGTTVRIVDTALKDLKGMRRMKRTLHASYADMLRDRATYYQARAQRAFRGSLVPLAAIQAA
ncbi:hypothetical protein HMPREF9156_00004 [Scardovia wiggsiae F0424]|uniref:dolichyl-phosphate beta-glucosyltransferase n=1 Tax=Scardovia wiggsiae F0424 TaxID=857290 RepID=J0D5I4_9BIFI|nr:dolichyl-phosphate beta-glucosyltransferase [Scardovia wiggsiae]EJD65240.1 hypothetical protein HMPREF9156_00004 [Scardovia wiggsiae F0424]